ncbi:hypothetical protein ACPPVO_58000 [Dactylosporangium sp. McL0621]|uniref:hypothetical protein n=1 Tax=Dactylosporangium sp. McL0621 TaxID=3415678 RepID=UPI003CED7CA3
MGVLHGLLVAGVIGLIAVAPCLVCVLLMSADEVFARGWERVLKVLPQGVRRRIEERSRRRGEERVAEHRWGARGRELRGGGWLRRRWVIGRVGRGVDQVVGARGARAVGPPIEQVAGDLRRLNRLRESVATRSRVWFVAVQEAYDEGLHTACAQLGIEEHLDEVSGIDLELERLRVEGELQRAGLVLRNTSAQPR